MIQIMHICTFMSKFLSFHGRRVVPEKYKDVFDPVEMITMLYYIGVFFMMIEFMLGEKSN